jgi:hypothetical protein
VTTAQITGITLLNLLEAIRIVNPNIRFYQASASFMSECVERGPSRLPASAGGNSWHGSFHTVAPIPAKSRFIYTLFDRSSRM